MDALITKPLDENEKIALLGPSAAFDPDRMLEEYVNAFIRKNNIGEYMLPRMIRRRIIVTSILSLILFLDIVDACFLHRHLGVNLFLIPVICLIIALVTLSRDKMKGYLIKEIKTRPDDDMDSILSSQVSGAKKAGAFRAVCAAILLVPMILCAVYFSTPHQFYEKNTMGGYSLRYYTYSLTIPDTIKLPDTYNGLPVNEIRGEVFKNLKITAIILPKDIKEIRGNTFENCTKLREITIPDGVTRIGGHAFYGCSSLRDVKVPASVKEIGSSAFRRCSSLYSIRLPRGCSVNERAFKESPTKIEWY